MKSGRTGECIEDRKGSVQEKVCHPQTWFPQADILHRFAFLPTCMRKVPSHLTHASHLLKIVSRCNSVRHGRDGRSIDRTFVTPLRAHRHPTAKTFHRPPSPFFKGRAVDEQHSTRSRVLGGS